MVFMGLVGFVRARMVRRWPVGCAAGCGGLGFGGALLGVSCGGVGNGRALGGFGMGFCGGLGGLFTPRIGDLMGGVGVLICLGRFLVLGFGGLERRVD